MTRRGWQTILASAVGLALLSCPALTTATAVPRENLDQQIAKWIAQLGDADYFARQRAQTELAKIGAEAYDAVLDATTHDDLEIAARAKYLLRLIRVDWSVESDPQEVRRLLHDYELKELNQRRHQLALLADLPHKAGVPALCRLVRYEQSEELSKWAAVSVMAMQPLEEALAPELRQTIVQGVGRSRRVAAKWLLAHQRLCDDPAAALPEWALLVAAEQTLLRRAPHQTNEKIVVDLLRIQVNALEKLKRIDEAVAVMQRLIQLERGDASSLVVLVEWLVDKKAWRLVDEAAARFSSRFDSIPMLAYLLAEAQLGRGDAAAAQRTIGKARSAYVGNSDDVFRMHMATANRLSRRGKHAWAELEYRDLVEKAGPQNQYTMAAYLGLSEMLHDQAQDQKAADALQEFFDKIVKKKANDELLTDERRVGEYRARLHFYRSCVARQKGDAAGEREQLELAFAAWPTEIDVLISSYRLTNATPEFRRKVREAIRKAGEEIREQIANAPHDAVYYNQLAWLAANTEGDLDEALKFSKLSIELSPTNGGFYDTLGRVYYARGDYDNAIRYQTKAAELEPHYGLIQKQLEFFQKESARKDGKKPSG